MDNLRYSRCHKDALMAMSALRAVRSVKVAERADLGDANYLWFALPEHFDVRKFPYLPHVVYEWRVDGLVELGTEVPSQPHFSKDVQWRPIQEWWGFSPEIVDCDLLELEKLSKVSLQIVADSGGVHSSSDGCLVAFAPFKRFVMIASDLRLEGLRFAMTSEGQVWIEGELLPSMDAKRFRLRDNIAVPLGMCWEPRVGSEIVNQLLGVTERYRILLFTDGKYDLIHPELIYDVTRANVRAAERTLVKGGEDE